MNPNYLLRGSEGGACLGYICWNLRLNRHVLLMVYETFPVICLYELSMFYLLALQVVLVSDIFAGTSDTLHYGKAQSEARRILLAKLPLSPLQRTFAAANDTGIRGMLELQVSLYIHVYLYCV